MHYLFEFSQKFGKTFTGVSPRVEAVLKEFNWTGNVRELKNVVERGVLLSDGPELSLQSLGLEEIGNDDGSKEFEDGTKLPSLSPSGIDFTSILSTIEKYYFLEALKIAKGNESKAAQLLQISRDTFRYRRKKLEEID
jgi:DNA-binding NtrC family response regulator